jgi:uncharacterized membrane protein YhaH (DUF805 family)
VPPVQERVEASMDWRELYFSPCGRISLRQYWLACLPLIGAQILAEILIMADVAPVIAALLDLAIVIPSVVLTIKRMHDRDRSGWFVLIVVIPLFGAIWLLVEAGLLPGDRGSNRFGPDPLEDGDAGSATSVTAAI